MTVRVLFLFVWSRDHFITMSVNGWLTILSRVDSNFPTGLTFDAYQSGFGDISSNFWLGLEKSTN
jgi:hypothetical protein